MGLGRCGVRVAKRPCTPPSRRGGCTSALIALFPLSWKTKSTHTCEKAVRPCSACSGDDPKSTSSRARDVGATLPWRGVPFFSRKQDWRYPIGRKPTTGWLLHVGPPALHLTRNRHGACLLPGNLRDRQIFRPCHFANKAVSALCRRYLCPLPLFRTPPGTFRPRSPGTLPWSSLLITLSRGRSLFYLPTLERHVPCSLDLRSPPQRSSMHPLLHFAARAAELCLLP